MAKWVWVTREDDLGLDPVDLHTCRRFIVADPVVHEWADELCEYYFTQDGRWVEVGPHPEDGVLFFRWADPMEVAHNMLWRYKHLPPELEKFREVASCDRSYFAWLVQRTAEKSGCTKPPHDTMPKPFWDRESRTLTVGTAVCRVYAKKAPNQFAILDSFEEKRWPTSIPNPLTSLEQMVQTIKDFNADSEPQSPLRLRQDNLRVSWKLTARPSSDNLP
jgi:hypothetical protein